MRQTRRAWFCVLGLAAIPAAVAFAQPAARDAAPAELVQQGRKLMNEGKHDDALALFQRALATSPAMFEANMAAGMVLDLKAQYVEARRYFATAIQAAKPAEKEQALIAMGVSYAFGGNANGSLPYYKQVFDARVAAGNFPAAAEAANALARIYLESRDVDAGRTWYQTGYDTARRKANPSAAETDLWSLRWEHAQARIQARLRHDDQARKHLAAVKALLDKGTNPEQAPVYPYLAGYVAFYRDDFKTAVAELRRADQQDPFLLNLLGQAYEGAGDAAGAKECWQRVVQSNAHTLNNALAREFAVAKLVESR